MKRLPHLLMMAGLLAVSPLSIAGQPTGVVSPALTAHLQKLENDMWEHWRRARYDAMSALMTPDSRFSGDTAWQTRSESLASMKAGSASCKVPSVSFTNFKTTALSSDAVLMTYLAAPAGTCGGNPVPKSLNSTVWVKRGGNWLTFFHQQSPVR